MMSDAYGTCDGQEVKYHDPTTTSVMMQLLPSRKRQQPPQNRQIVSLIFIISFMALSSLITMYRFNTYVIKFQITNNYQQSLRSKQNCSCTSQESSSSSLKPCTDGTLINSTTDMMYDINRDVDVTVQIQDTNITTIPTSQDENNDESDRSNSNDIMSDQHDTKTTTSSYETDNIVQTSMQEQSPSSLKLRLNWTNLKRFSTLSQQIADMQNDCSITNKGNFGHRNFAGLGSDIHQYSRAICNALELKYYPKQLLYNNENNPSTPIITHTNRMYRHIPVLPPVRVRTIGNWTWKSLQHCKQIDPNNVTIQSSTLKCYFPQSELQCSDDFSTNDDVASSDDVNTNHAPGTRMLLDGGNIDIKNMSEYSMTYANGDVPYDCPSVLNSTNNNPPIIRAATTEFLFTRVSKLVQDEGERQLNLVFQNTSQIPKNLITVHLRWGDKIAEMKLSPISQYISAIRKILQHRIEKRNNSNNYNNNVSISLNLMDTGYETTTGATNENVASNVFDDSVNIFLCTEDPIALESFRDEAPDDWNIYVDQYYTEYLPYRQQMGDVYNANVITATEMEGKTGLLAMGSLLVAMEANDYVLTTRSNWSRLMNELRLNVINPRCDGCTTMIDLNPSRGKFERI